MITFKATKFYLFSNTSFEFVALSWYDKHMACIRPFKALRYSTAAGKIEDLVAPPYDVISSEERDEYITKNPSNIVNLTLPLDEEGDRSKFVKYARSAAKLNEWRNKGILRF